MISYYYIADNDGVVRPCKAGATEYKQEGTVRIMTFDHVAIAQQRPRTRVIQPKDRSKKAYAQIYTVNSKKKKQLLKLIVPRPLNEVATFVYALALYKPPKSYNSYKPEKSYGLRKVTKPDGTNILKFYEDLLEGLFMPKDQYANPTMCERYYADYNQLIFCTVESDMLEFNLPRVIKKYFLNSLFIQ